MHLFHVHEKCNCQKRWNLPGEKKNDCHFKRLGHTPVRCECCFEPKYERDKKTLVDHCYGTVEKERVFNDLFSKQRCKCAVVPNITWD